jgi:nucleotide-binding universal stress UspA family protein
MYTSIVVGTDGSPTASLAVNEAARLAKAFDAPLHVVSAFRTVPNGAVAYTAGEPAAAMAMGEWAVDARAAVEEQLEGVAAQLNTAGIAASTSAVGGDPVDAILEVAEQQKADLIVVGNKGMHGARRVLGSVPNSVAHKAACTVLIVKTS